jgi:hypothetical protein
MLYSIFTIHYYYYYYHYYLEMVGHHIMKLVNEVILVHHQVLSFGILIQ